MPLSLLRGCFTDLAARRGERGIQPWLGGYVKGPALLPGERLVNDLHMQVGMIETKLLGWR